jgi:hypothetical protein
MSKEIEDGGPAFPQNLPDDFVWRLPGDPGGMSIRDWFAGQCLSGLCSLGKNLEDSNATDECTQSDVVATTAYYIADAMLKARNSKHE